MMAPDLIGGYGRGAPSERLGAGVAASDSLLAPVLLIERLASNLGAIADSAKATAVFSPWSDGPGTRTPLLHVPSVQGSHDIHTSRDHYFH